MQYIRHIYAKAADIAKATMCKYPQFDHELPHWKCVLRFYAKCPCINLPDQEKDNHNSDTTLSIRFHIYHVIVRCTDHGRIPLKDKKDVTCVNKNLQQTNQQNYTPEKN